MRHRVVVRRRWPWTLPVALGLLLAAGLVGAHAGWRWWNSPARVLFRDPASELERLREDHRRVVRELRAVRAELDEARGRSTFESRSREIDAQACDAVRATIAGLETEAAELREQLAFYRNVAAPDQIKAGVRVLHLALRQAGDDGLWRYELVLVQPIRRDRLATGRWELGVEGVAGQQVKTLRLEDLRIGTAGDDRFAFRAFQEFAGELRIPAGFRPSRLSVTLRVHDGSAGADEVSESFDWSRVATAQE